jgi:hypothetical protein
MDMSQGGEFFELIENFGGREDLSSSKFKKFSKKWG